MGQSLAFDGLFGNFEIWISIDSPALMAYFISCLPSDDGHLDFSNVLRGIGVSLNAIPIMDIDCILG